MKKYVRATTDRVIFEDSLFSFVKESGVGINDTPWTGLKVISKGLAKKHVVEIRLNSRGWHDFDGEPVDFEYSGCYIAHGMRSTSDTLDETAEYIDVLEDAYSFALQVDEWLQDQFG